MSERQGSSQIQQVYHLPAAVGRQSLVAVVLFWSLLVCAIVLVLRVGERVLETALFSVFLFGPLGWHCLNIWKRRADSIHVSSTAISVHRANKARLSMRWDEVVQVREHFFRRRLDLVDARRRVLRIDFQLRDFARLREIIQARGPRLRDKQALTRVFHRYSLGRWIWLVLLGLLGGFAFLAMVSRDWTAALTITAFAALLGAWAFSEVRSVKVGRREVLLQRLIGARRVPYADITRIDLVDPEQEGITAGVILALSSGEEIKLQQFLESYLELFDSLSNAWISGRSQP